jgi:hypothetical protein
MKRIIATMLVASMALQSAGCTTTYPASPTIATAAPVRASAAGTVANQNPNQVVAAACACATAGHTHQRLLGQPGRRHLSGVALVV